MFFQDSGIILNAQFEFYFYSEHFRTVERAFNVVSEIEFKTFRKTVLLTFIGLGMIHSAQNKIKSCAHNQRLYGKQIKRLLSGSSKM